ncbi:MAG: endonuclease [Bacteroidota bacterium]
MKIFFRSLIIIALLQLSLLAQTDYYSTISTSDPGFITKLHNLINNHYQIYYSNFDETNIRNFASMANSDGTRSVFCVYTNYEYKYTEPFAWGVMSREHTWCHSWMPTYPDESGKEYSDQHHLFPANQDNANGVRNNYPLGEVVTIISSFQEGKFGYDAAGNKVYEPRNAHKGDAARALFYMSVCYDGTGGRWTIPNSSMSQTQDVLKKWHKLDPPDQWEKDRNNYIYSIQNNRNPFVDHPEYADYIDFSSLTYYSGSNQLATEPAYNLSGLTVSGTTENAFTLSWTDAMAGTQAPSGYLLVISTSQNSNVPVDRTPYVNDLDLSDGSGLVNISYASENSYTFTKLLSSTNYYVTVYSYNGTLNEINYKTDGSIPQISVKTLDAQQFSYNESFGNFAESGSSYKDGTFLGLDGSLWSYKQCRGDKQINGSTPCLGKDRTPASEVASGTIKGGCKTLKFDYMQAFSTNVKLDVFVNSTKITTLTTNSELGVVKTTEDIPVNIDGDVVIRLVQTSGGGQVSVDNIRWTAFSNTPVELASFSAELAGRSVVLSWTTATETNNLGFSVERRKADGQQWKHLGFVKGAGNSTVASRYSFSDTPEEQGMYMYRLKQTDLDGSYTYSAEIEANALTARSFELYQNYPNPFNPSTSIKYSVAEASHVTFTIYDQLGRRINELVNGFQEAGIHEVHWDASSVTSGVYYYELRSGANRSMKKMIMIK